jgi:hypothetical protein
MTNIVPLKNSKLHPLRALKKFCNDADMLVDRYDELERLLSMVPSNSPGNEVAAGFAHAKKLATLSEHDEKRIARCHDALETFDPESAYEDNDREDGLRRGVIGERLAMLVGAFPNGAPSDPVVYVTTLVESIVTVEDLCLPALDAAVWEIVGTMKFIPAIEVLVELNRQQEKWSDRFWAIHNLGNKSRRLLTRIDALESEAQRIAAERAEQQQAAAKARAVQQAQRDLDNAQASLVAADAELVEAREVVAAALGWCLQCQDEVLKSEQALAEVVKRSDDTNE